MKTQTIRKKNKNKTGEDNLEKERMKNMWDKEK
jgi:hypothetical protein